MTAPTTTLILLRQAIMRKLYTPFTPVVSTTTGAGAVNYVTDSTLRASNIDEDFTGAWLMIVEAGGGAALNEITRVSGVDFSFSAVDNLQVAPNWTGAPGNGIDYEIHRWFHPTYVRQKINEILESMRHEVILALTMCHDGNMEGLNADVGTDWTSSTATLSKVTTQGRVVRGMQALRVLATASPGQARSQTMDVYPGEELLVAAEVYVTAGDSARLILYDIDNSAEIEAAALVSFSGYATLEFKAQVPATCTRVALRLEATNNTDDVFFSNAICLPTRRREYLSALFPELEWAEDFLGAYALPAGNAIVDTGADSAYELFTREMIPEPSVTMTRRDQSANPWSIVIPEGFTIEHPIFIKIRRDYPTLSSDTDTTYAPSDYVTDLVVAELLDERAAGEFDEVKAAKLEKRAAAIRYKLTPRAMEVAKPRTRVNGAVARWSTSRGSSARGSVR